jgi:tetratricopeptide (TPR) repeat protein
MTGLIAAAWRGGKGYGESMPAPQDDEDLEPPDDAWASRVRARQWRRAALALAFLFASLPMSSRIFLGSWRFDGALDLAGLCLVAAAYLYFVGRERRSPIPDSAAILDEALRLAGSGQTKRGLALLDEALRLSPELWQARQYRGELRLGDPDAAESALKDFTEAIRLAPGEPHLYILRSQAFTLLGRDSSARADLEAAARLSGDAGTAAEL